jgi:hypothetical protein
MRHPNGSALEGRFWGVHGQAMPGVGPQKSAGDPVEAILAAIPFPDQVV